VIAYLPAVDLHFAAMVAYLAAAFLSNQAPRVAYILAVVSNLAQGRLFFAEQWFFALQLPLQVAYLTSITGRFCRSMVAYIAAVFTYSIEVA
jgi:hypothetical protein